MAFARLLAAALITLVCPLWQGTFRAVAPWAEPFSTPYNTSWDVPIPLDLRGFGSWALVEAALENEMVRVCGRVAATPALAFGLRSQKWRTLDPGTGVWVSVAEAEPRVPPLPACAQDLVRQAEAFVAAVCAREPSRAAGGDGGVDACVNPTPLLHLATLAGSDKGAAFHSFAGFYDEQLTYRTGFGAHEFRPQRILELGVLRGASLAAWAAKYPCAQVLGLDLAVDALLPGRYTAAVADQSSLASLRAAVPADATFELIVDDGGHSMAQQQVTLAALWPNLAPCGVFVVEDLHSSLQWVTHPEFADAPVATLDLVTGAALTSALVDFAKVRAEASSVELFRNGRPSQPHRNDDGSSHVLTVIIHKRCAL